MGRLETQCPKCGRLFWTKVYGGQAFAYGSPFINCPKCGAELFDRRYHEMALEGKPGVPLFKKLFSGGGQGGKPSPEEQRIEKEFRESVKRTGDYSYVAKLESRDYSKINPSSAKVIHDLIAAHTRPYLGMLLEKGGAPFPEFRLREQGELVPRIVYSKKDPESVRKVVRQVLAHYGLNSAGYEITVEYTKEIPKEGGTLGTFTARGTGGGTVRIVIAPKYNAYQSIVAVALHECAHAFLNARGIRLADFLENERLTDAAAIFLGGGKYVLAGCYRDEGNIGYLKKAESEYLESEVARLRGERAKREKEEMGKYLPVWKKKAASCRKMLKALEEQMPALRPEAVVREASIEAEALPLFRKWEERKAFFEQLLGEAGNPEDIGADRIRKEAAGMDEYEKELSAYCVLAKEWGAVQAWQQALPKAKRDVLSGMREPAAAGNVFAKLELVRIWSGCPETMRDAEKAYREFRRNDGDGDSLCAAALCHLEGLAGQKDRQEGKGLLCMAAALGSQDAVRLLTKQTD